MKTTSMTIPERWYSRPRLLLPGILLIAILSVPAPVSGQQPVIFATAAARESFFAELSPGDLRQPLPEPDIHRGISGPPVLVRVEEQNDHRYYTFLPPSVSGPDIAVPGAFIVKQRMEDGAFQQIKIFLQRDEGAFLRLTPRQDRRTLEMEVSLGGVLFYQDVTVPLTMERAIVVPVAEIQRVTAGLVDWSLAAPDLGAPGYRSIASIVGAVRNALPSLPDGEDGALDRDGRLVSIRSLTPLGADGGLNCSGFAKWVVDGLYNPVAGSNMAIESLRVKHLDRRGTRWSARVEDTRDPYFGLDWTRNIAIQMAALNDDTDPALIDPESRDVRAVPVARYREDVGYPVADLWSVLYWLAVEDPGTIYLGSISEPFGEDVILRQHSHVVVLMPYFDESGRYRPIVMERNQETGITSIEERYGEDHIHLVRIATNDLFSPPEIVTEDEPLLFR